MGTGPGTRTKPTTQKRPRKNRRQTCRSLRERPLQSQSRDTADKLSSTCRHSRFRRSARLARKKARPREGNSPRDADKAHDAKTPSKPSADLPGVTGASVGRKAAILLTNFPRFADIPALPFRPTCTQKGPPPRWGQALFCVRVIRRRSQRLPAARALPQQPLPQQPLPQWPLR